MVTLQGRPMRSEASIMSVAIFSAEGLQDELRGRMSLDICRPPYHHARELHGGRGVGGGVECQDIGAGFHDAGSNHFLKMYPFRVSGEAPAPHLDAVQKPGEIH